MKKLFFILILLFLSINLFSQKVYSSPQTIVWDAYQEIPIVGTIEYEVFLIPLPESRIISAGIKNEPQKQIYLNRTSIESIVVDIQSANLQGDFVIAIRTVYTYNETIQRSVFAFSDNKSDLDPSQEPFFLRYVRGVNKPTMILFNGG